MQSRDCRLWGGLTKTPRLNPGQGKKLCALPKPTAMESARLLEEVTELSIRDDLTGCYSRGHFFICLKREIDMTSLNGGLFSLVIFNIDDFKLGNDRYGHLTVGLELKEIMRISGQSLLDSDHPFPLGRRGICGSAFWWDNRLYLHRG